MVDKAKIIIDWNNDDGIDSHIVLGCSKEMKGKVVRILIAQLEILKTKLIQELDESETQKVKVEERR